MKILHLAVQNYAGMPMDFVCMHKQMGIESSLITLFPGHPAFNQGYCLNLYQPSGKLQKLWHKFKFQKRFQSSYISLPPKVKPVNKLESIFFKSRDLLNRRKILRAIEEKDIYKYDIIHLDGGMGFFRKPDIIRQLKAQGKKIVCVYFGSDLRIRGIFEEVEELADLSITLEYDHLCLYDKLEFLFTPFDVSDYRQKDNVNEVIRIVHSPTNRELKGTRYILEAISNVKKKRKIDFMLLENIPHSKVLEIKSKCDIAIEQVGNFGGEGYGKNSLETLSMGIPTITDFSDEYYKFLPENPFVRANSSNLEEVLLSLIDSKDKLLSIGQKSRQWVEKYHSYNAVNSELIELYKKYHII